MFADSLLDSGCHNRSLRGWSTLASFALQAVGLACVVVIPLLYTSHLPQLHLAESILTFAPSPAPAAPQPHKSSASGTANARAVEDMVTPRSVPRQIAADNTPQAPDAPNFDEVVGTAEGVRSSGNGIPHSLGDGVSFVAPPPPPPVAHPQRISRIMEGNLIYRVEPEYPALAKLAHLQGAVTLRAVIGKQGTIQNLQAVSGPPLLIKAAIDAIKQWRYRPYLLNGEPVEVDSQITVNFLFSGWQ
jgi:periplasmic protein TonB